MCDTATFKFHSGSYIPFWTNTLGKGENPCTPGYSTTTVLPQKWHWYHITHESWYAIKRRNQAKPFLLHIAFWYHVFLSNTNNLQKLVKLQAFLYNQNNYIILSNYVWLIIAICLSTVVWFQVSKIFRKQL